MKKIDRPLVSRHIELYEEDWDFLVAQYGRGTATSKSTSSMVREIVHAAVVNAKRAQQQALEPPIGGLTP